MLIGHVRALRILCAVARSASFSDAGRALGLTQSAVSQHIAGLERAVGTPLVVRGSRPVLLTEAGAVLARHGLAVLAELESAEQALGEIEGRLATRLRLGSFPTALVSFVGSALVRMREQSPDLVLTVTDDHMQRLVAQLRSGELDLAVVYEHPALPGDELADLPRAWLFDDTFRVLLPAVHPLAARSHLISLRDLRHDRWIGGRPVSAWFRIVQQACRAAGFEPQTALATDDYRAVQAFVAAGLGVAVVPGLAAHRPPPGVVVRTLSGAPARRISVARLPGEPVRPQITLMTELLVEATAGLRPPTAPAAPPRP